MKNLRFFDRLVLLLFTIVLFACSSDDNVPAPQIKGQYSSGVFIINEGNFGTDNSAISFYDRAIGAVQNNIFKGVNGRPLGNTAQSMSIIDTLAYIVVNASNKLEVVSYANFTSKGGIDEGLVNPRYFAALGNKGYITNWGDFGEVTSFIAVVDLNTLTISDKIITGNGPEAIRAIEGKLFFTNNFDNTLGILNPSTGEVVEVSLHDSPAAMVEDKIGKLWVICGGGYDENYQSKRDGKLFRVNPITHEIERTIDLGLAASKMAINEGGDTLFYVSGNEIYQLSIDAEAAPESAWVVNESGSFYSVGYDPVENIIYAGDANAFQGSGTVYRYGMDGTLLNSFEVGIGPNNFVFK